jgi:hypothetical protein
MTCPFFWQEAKIPMPKKRNRTKRIFLIWE